MTHGRADLHLGVIGNCQVAALIDSLGNIVWACLPRPDGDPVFCSLLGGDGAGDETQQGMFAIEMRSMVRAEQTYVRNSAVLQTILTDSAGSTLRITDFCPRYRARGRMFRPMMLVRIVEPLGGRPIVTTRLRPCANYGERRDVGSCGSHSLRFKSPAVDYRVTTDASMSALVEERPIGLDRPMVFILGPDETVTETPGVLARSLLEETILYWQDWVRSLAVPFDWQEAVIRAAITLKLCTYEDSGAVLAALTTSIPEHGDSGRNWDYRYCWLRDSYFVIQALNRLGATRTMEAYLQYLDHVVSEHAADALQPLYSLGGGAEADERVVASLPGYRGMGPVRIGNLAAKQVQNDVYGAVILATSQMFFDERLVQRGDQALFRRLQLLGDRAAALYGNPDAGPWEFRGVRRIHTFSAAMSWAGCDRLARIASRLKDKPAIDRWCAAADSMKAEILSRSWNSRRGAFTSAFDGDELDATALLLPELGLLPATDLRFRSTVERMGDELRTGDLIYRYRHVDDFGEPQTAFTVCAFWHVNALAALGRVEEARDVFSRLLAMRNPLGILSEDIDPANGELWGNFPQTYSMVGVINSALRLSRSWDEAL